jgi:hypothetical protein
MSLRRVLLFNEHHLDGATHTRIVPNNRHVRWMSGPVG